MLPSYLSINTEVFLIRVCKFMMFCFHNWIIHPLLPMGFFLEIVGSPFKIVGEAIGWLHDHTYPYDD